MNQPLTSQSGLAASVESPDATWDPPSAAPQAAYTRGAVDAYLVAVAERRQELRAEIRAAEARAARAELAAGRVGALERSVGELVVGAIARNFDDTVSSRADEAIAAPSK